jgi:hypothetical protein
MNPYQLDCIINGTKVFIYRRPDSTVHASIHNFECFGEHPIETVRVKLDEKSTVESVENDPRVIARLSALSSQSRGQQ